MARVPDTAVTTSGRTVTVRLDNVPEVDGFTFYDPQPPSGNVAAVASFVMSYTKAGVPRQVRPTSTDPKSPFNWAGAMWKATGAVTFTVAYATGTFAVQGSAQSAGNFGEMGMERNGYFLHH
jgi:hypothetical protein